MMRVVDGPFGGVTAVGLWLEKLGCETLLSVVGDEGVSRAWTTVEVSVTIKNETSV